MAAANGQDCPEMCSDFASASVSSYCQEGDAINVAVIGAGFLGARIITEMLLLGNNVVRSLVLARHAAASAVWGGPMATLLANEAVFDQNIAKQRDPQRALNETVGSLLLECDRRMWVRLLVQAFHADVTSRVRQGLLGLAEMASPKGGKWTPHSGEPPRQAKVSCPEFHV